MNSSIVAILLSSIFIFIFNFIYAHSNCKKITLVYYIIILLVTAFSIYFFFRGRAALAAAFVNIFYLIYYSRLYFSKKIYLKAAAGLILIITILFFFQKKDSSNGRLLIYKVVFTELKTKDYILGLGFGKFKVQYNQLQASYFKKHYSNNKDVMLAGNGYYLFNDWLQFVLEIGLIKLLIIGCTLAFFSIFLHWQPRNKKLLFAIDGTLICISFAAFFSYPLQVPIILFLFLICLFLHCFYSYSFKKSNNTKYARFFLTANISGIILIGIPYLILVHQYKLKSNLAFELYRDGFKQKADSIFTRLSKYPFADYNTCYNHAYLLFFKNDLNSSLIQINKALTLAYSTEGVKLKANILTELNKLNEAEHYYIQAIYITPNRMIPKFNLLQFYLKNNQLLKAKYWAYDICNMPVKIPSSTTLNIQYQAKNILLQLKSN